MYICTLLHVQVGMVYMYVATFIVQHLIEFSEQLVALGKAGLVNCNRHLARKGITMTMDKHKRK